MLGGDFGTPIMYEDIGKYYTGMNPMMMPGMYGMYGMGMMPYGMGMMNPYLGKVQLQPILDHDKVQIMNKHKEEDKSTFKKAMLALGGLLLIGFIPTIRKGIKNSGGVINYIKNLYHGTLPKGPSFGQKVKNAFGKFGSGTKSLFKKIGTPFKKVGSSIASGFKKAAGWIGGKFGKTPIPRP